MAMAERKEKFRAVCTSHGGSEEQIRSFVAAAKAKLGESRFVAEMKERMRSEGTGGKS